MALQVWLPLDGDLRNNGLKNIVVSNNGATINDNGKIGKCYSLVNGQYITLNNLSFSLLTNCSISFWIKITGKGSSGWLPFSGQSQNQYVLATKSGTGAFYHGGVGSATKIVYCDGIVRTTPINDNNWHHYCVTGINLSSWTAFYINNYFEYPAAWNFSGSVNDVRIYDHCLSPKEIKEISKALILHYKLDDAYCESTSNLGGSSISYSNKTDGQSQALTGWGGDAGTVTFYKSGGYNNGPYKVYHKTATGTGGVYSKTANDITIEAGKTYTMSIYVKASRDYTDSTYSFNINGVTANDSNHYITATPAVHFTTEWTRIVRTFTAGENDAGTYGEMSIIYNDTETDYYVYFSCFQIEEGNHATPWVNGSRATTTIYDSSGYLHNGTITGKLVVNNDSPRYNYGTNYPDSACSIRIGNFSTMVPEGIFTFNIWFKKVTDEWSTKNYETIFGGPSGFELEAKNASTNSPSLVLWNWGKGSITYPLDTWNMVTFVRTPSGTKLYLNGVQGATGTAGSIPSGNYFIGSWNSSLAQNYRGYFSDARIYATELSDEDILELYNKPANIDNKGNMFSCEFDEVDTNKPQILKTGITNINNLLEFNDRLKVLSDGSVFLQIMHHNNPASNLFTTNNCWFYNDKNNLFSNLIMLKNCTWIKNLTTFEFLACEKLESSSTENQIRWSQTSNPALTSTATGYTLISGSPGRTVALMNKGTNGAMHNGATWWCCCGSYTAYQGGIPGFCGVVKSGYIDLYIKIPNDVIKGNFENFVKFYKKSILSTQLIEK